MSQHFLTPGWRCQPFTAFANIVFSGVDKKADAAEAPVRLCNYVDVFHNHEIVRGIAFMEATATPREIEKFRLKIGDIVFTKDSETAEEIAEPAYVAEDLGLVLCGYHLAIARPYHDVDGRFLYYAMREPRVRRQFSRVSNGVTRFGLTLDALDSVHLLRPPLAEQRRIADILTTWDKAVAAAEAAQTRATCLYLGTSARIIRCRGAGMRPLGELLIPDQMEKVIADGPFRALGVRSHGKGTFQRIDDLAALGSNKTLYRVEAGRFIVNIVFAWEGAAAITSVEDIDCFVSHRFPTFTIRERVLSPDYFRHVIRMDGFRQLLALASPGGAGRNKTLNRRDLLRFEVHVPPLPDQRRIAETLSTLDSQARKLERYVQCLTAQREALATKLLTGRLRVPEAERLAAIAG